MAYSGAYPWDANYNDYNSYNNSSGAWSTNKQNYPTQSEQYNPVYPSLNGTSNFFSSSAQEYDAAPYHPSSTSNSGNRTNRIPKTQQRGRRYENQRKSKQTFPAKKFHLVTIDPNSNEKPIVSKIAEPAPNPVVKVARGNTKTVNSPRGGRGINKKMPNFRLQGNNWESNQYQGGTRGGRGGGGKGRGRGGFHRGGKSYGPPKPTNDKDDIKYVHLPEDSPAILLTVSSDNIVAFHGFDSVFTTQHSFPVLVDGKIYKSCDHYYQICKVTDLTGISSDKLNSGVRNEDGKLILEAQEEKDKKAYSAIAKEIIKAAGIEKDKVDEWRNTKGLEAIQRALHAKAAQSAHLREALKETGEQILVHAFPRDSIYGTGCAVPAIKKWLDDMEKSGVKTLRIPANFPLNQDTVQHCPVFAQGRNILGVILMQLREKIRNGGIEIVDMSKIYNALRNNPTEPMDTTPKVPYYSDDKSFGTF
ncbi:hypothetical protein GCK72_005405 [Caenorhabditis remanei]|uniref:NADAR domain-containing protein n=1 Tax=Caenorhabditis remanei TaxID=31234 RepID=E3LFE5_CAERE|nr:hypothetical protein GCK72_005405 [Caenorhabditis remanei]EFO86093.1 hypothetical protein CRE_01778 [Caenorhabditis remanei]KAF1765453.1 hypothetical protein GCK72_005405 [Caenorhabditis remanei]